ncbi:MAG: PhnD/SsuA/transferrin family substrate-binding protein [Myxococcota bacterium]
MRRGWSFGLPPTVGNTMGPASQASLALNPIGCRIVRQALTYGALIKDLEDGRVHVAWAPPLVCAHVESRGGRVLLRARRHGTTQYRAVIFGRKERKLEMEFLRGQRAAWPDAQSMSGFILPRAMMRVVGLNPEAHLAQQRFLGSFKACVEAVLDGKADFSSIYASSSDAAVEKLGYAAHAGPRAGELAPVAVSPDCPNDGIVLSPRVTGKEVEEFARAFEIVAKDPVGGVSLARAVDVEGFEVPPAGVYERLTVYLSNPTAALADLLGRTV